MFELDDETRRALQARLGPSSDAHARVLAGLRGTLGGPLGPEGGESSSGPTGGAVPGEGGQLLWLGKIIAATAGLTGAGLLSLKLGVEAVRSFEAAPEPTPVRASADPPAASPPATDRAIEVPAGPEPELAPASELPARPYVGTRGAPVPAAPARSDLTAELALLDAAERVREQDPAAALRLLQQHRREFPAGVLAHERDVLRERIERTRIDSTRAGD